MSKELDKDYVLFLEGHIKELRKQLREHIASEKDKEKIIVELQEKINGKRS